MITTLTDIMTALQALDVGFAGIGEPSGNNGAWLRITPSGVSDYHYDTARVEPLQFQILVKHSNELTAIAHIDTIKDALEAMDIMTYVHPNFIDKDEKRALYSAMFQTKIYKGVN